MLICDVVHLKLRDCRLIKGRATGNLLVRDPKAVQKAETDLRVEPSSQWVSFFDIAKA